MSSLAAFLWFRLIASPYGVILLWLSSGHRSRIQQEPYALRFRSRTDKMVVVLVGGERRGKTGKSTSVWPYWAASCRGVYNRSLAMLGSAP